MSWFTTTRRVFAGARAGGVPLLLLDDDDALPLAVDSPLRGGALAWSAGIITASNRRSRRCGAAMVPFHERALPEGGARLRFVVLGTYYLRSTQGYALVVPSL